MRRSWLLLLLLMLAGYATLLPLQARPRYKKELADHFGPFLAHHLNDCRTCHLQTDGHDKPHNPFGARVKSIRRDLHAAEKKTDIGSRLEAMANEDSDGDGVSNLIELLAGTFPGEKADKPTAEQVAEIQQRLTAFRNRRIYHFRPFEKVERPEVPQVKNTAWVRNPIDAFLAEQHELLGLKPRPEASKPVLLRRLYLDLIGLPPPPEELNAFLADTSPNAYEKVVDHLLASPRHGERWARHWMDVWRYTDYGDSGLQDGWLGAPNPWRWRDWIIHSLNADKGYDRMVQEMLAADELCPDDLSAQPATGYLARNRNQSRHAWLHDTVGHTTRAFLGVTLECSRCHDHMYDKLSQEEFYRFRAIFEPLAIRTDPAPDGRDREKGGEKGGLTRVYDSGNSPTFLLLRGDEQRPDKSKPLQPGVPEILNATSYTVAPVNLPLAGYAPHRNPALIERLKADAARKVADARTALEAARRSGSENSVARAEVAAAQARLDAAEAAQAALEAVLRVEELEEKGDSKSREWEEQATATFVAQRQARLTDAQQKYRLAELELARADDKLRDKARKAVLDAEKVVAKFEQEAKQAAKTTYQKRGSGSYPKTSTGRRLALAKWTTSRDNPLAARVAVNHIWLRHFGTAIVPSVFDFGAAGIPPSHPALLDWLAVELMESKWSMKHIHRLIVTSSAYRMASTPDAANHKLDPSNLFLWRMPTRRMEGEIVRDSLLGITGGLDLTMDGPEIDTKLANQVHRRSIYFRYTESDFLRFLEPFDPAAPEDCYRRAESIVPQQALSLLNSDLALARARLLAREMSPKLPEETDFVKAAFERVLSRPATAAEVETCLKYLAEQKVFLESRKPGGTKDLADATKGAADSGLRARENVVHLLFNHNDFVTIR